MNASHFTLPTKACHNCRRRRWKCDRSLPVCQKCLSSGSECLGYGKLFVWAQGVASRGRMTGKSFEEPKSPKRENQGHVLPSHAKGRQELQHQADGINPSSDGASNDLSQLIHLLDTAVQRPLVDPLFQDLDQHSRYYLFHFATQLCSDMVVYDGPGLNPMRDLIPATSTYPLLMQIVLANAAFHVFNISRDPLDSSAYQEEKKPCLVAYYKAVTKYGGPLKTAYRDALVAKSQALSLLAHSVTTVNESNIDIILVTILLFINYDLIESGKDKWKVHMDGGRKLINLLGTPSYQPHAMNQLRIHMLAEFLVFYILGSTFCLATAPNLIPDTIDLEPILQYAETNNYLSCPAPLLRVMLKSFNLTDIRDEDEEVTTEVLEQFKGLLKEALAFDPVEWLRTFQPTSPYEDLEKRLHIAFAHRSGVCIYLARFIPCTDPVLDPTGGQALISLTGLADNIVHHISQLCPTDTLFKSISWPLFLAGAESETPAQRTWIANALDEFYNQMYWGYIHAVKRVLEAIWTCKDNAIGGAPNCWVTDVKEMGVGVLIA